MCAPVCELGITFAQRSVRGKSNEIPAVQELLKERNLSGCIVVADALNYQKKTARAIVDGKADYLLCAKELGRCIRNLKQRESKQANGILIFIAGI